MKAVMVHVKLRWKVALGEDADRLEFRTPDGFSSGGPVAQGFVIHMDWSIADVLERVRAEEGVHAERTKTLRIEYLLVPDMETSVALDDKPAEPTEADAVAMVDEVLLLQEAEPSTCHDEMMACNNEETAGREDQQESVAAQDAAMVTETAQLGAAHHRPVVRLATRRRISALRPEPALVLL